MTNLYIVRHGIAVEPGTPGIADDDRPLTSQGEKRLRQIALGLHRLDLKIDRVLYSPLPRARATAEIVARILGLEKSLETSDLLLPGTDIVSIESMLAARTEQNLMIVGHNPSLSQLLSLLVLGNAETPICDLKKGSVAALTASPPGEGRYQLSWLGTPRLLRRLGSAAVD
jgi:phosphohistidine phosphatase